MMPITLEDILSLEEYEQERDEQRKQIILLKVKRRIALDDVMTLVFENRKTVIYQIHEMIRTERIIDPVLIEKELKSYNEFIPNENQLSATLFFELRDLNKMSEDLERFQGMEQGEHLWFELPTGDRVVAVFETMPSDAENLRSVYHISFTFTKEQVDAFRGTECETALVLEHPVLNVKTVLSGDVRRELTEDLS